MTIEERIRILEELAQGILSSEKRNQKTEQEYTKISRRILSKPGGLTGLSPGDRRKRSWYKIRAALRWFLSSKIINDMERIESLQASADEQEKILSGAEAALRVMTTGSLSRAASFDPSIERRENKSKRKTLGSFPSTWPEQIFDSAPASLKSAIAVHYLSGCRPEELSKGILVLKSPREITFVVQGAKTYQKSDGLQIGQGERRITVKLSDDLEKKMSKSLPSEGGIIHKKEAVRVGLWRLSKTLFPRHARPISAYSFRHLFSSRLKKSGADESEIATAMGHASTRTQSMYGTSRQSSGRKIHVEATGEVDPRKRSRGSAPRVAGNFLEK